MRIKNVVLFCAVMMAFSGFTLSRAEVEINASVNFSELDNYGEWVVVPGYGTVWRPDAGPDWRPFVYGHWVYSNEGWVWDSDEPFGWIVCHYGNWYYDDNHGWVWLPGNTWSPARVRWYVTDDEIGWEPLFPERRPGHHWDKIHMQWTFCPVQFFIEGDVRSHVSFHPRPKASEVSVHVYSGPPRREFVQRIVHTPIVSISLNKVRVMTNNRSLVRVEVGSRERPHVDVPIGPMYKRTTVRSEPESRSTVHVTHEEVVRPTVRQGRSDNPRVIVQPQSDQPERRAKVEVQSRHDENKDRDNDQNNNRDNNNNGQERHRARVEVHTR